MLKTLAWQGTGSDLWGLQVPSRISNTPLGPELITSKKKVGSRVIQQQENEFGQQPNCT